MEKKYAVTLLLVILFPVLFTNQMASAVGQSINNTPLIGTYSRSELELSTPYNLKVQSRNTQPTTITYGPYYYKVKGSTLNSFPARYFSTSLNLDTASRRAVLNKHGRINANKTYNIRWYNRVNHTPTSVKGIILRVTNTN